MRNMQVPAYELVPVGDHVVAKRGVVVEVKNTIFMPDEEEDDDDMSMLGSISILGSMFK